MTKKVLILSIALVSLIIGIILGVSVYYLLLYPKNPINSSAGGAEEKTEGVIELTPAQQLEKTKKDYPEVIQGIISFLDTKNSLKTTVKTDDGKEYILWPPQPKSVYESFGAKNNGRVEIQARFLEEGKLGWGLMKPI